MANLPPDGPPPDRLEADCPACGGTRGVPERTLRDHVSGEWFRISRCPDCTARFVQDPPPAAALGRYYENAAGGAMHTSPGRLFERARRVAMTRELRPLRAVMPGDGVLVDVGTGDGSVAALCAEEGLRAHGVDIYPESEWRRAGVPYHRYDPALPFDPVLAEIGPIDGLVMRHVLEHLPSPYAAMSSFAAAGVRHVFAIVPNVDSRLIRLLGDSWYYWDPPRHLTFFNRRSLTALADRTGYRVLHLDTAGIDELATSGHRAAAIRAMSGGRDAGVMRGVSRVLRPTGIVAGVSSALSAPVSDTVCRVVFALAD